jgi:NitT/TauT family transport system permease protein
MKIPKVFAYILSIVLLLLLWKLFALVIDSAVLPSPENALLACAEALKTIGFWQHFEESGVRVVISMVISLAIAFPLGIVMGYNQRVDRILAPILFLTYPVPKIVFLPVVFVLFGLGNVSKIVLIVLIVSYQLLVIIRDGVTSINKKHIETIHSMGGSHWQIIRHALIPAALPSCFTALRLSTGTAITVLFLTETYATRTGLGYYIMDSWGRAAYDDMFVGIIGMGVLGIIFYLIFSVLERNICRWKMLERVKMVTLDNA